MTDIAALIAQLQQNRVTLHVSNGQLKVEAPHEVLTEQVRQTIKQHKAAIIACLSASKGEVSLQAPVPLIAEPLPPQDSLPTPPDNTPVATRSAINPPPLGSA